MKKSDPKYSAASDTNSIRISLWLDSYDDIFSDFDPRPIQERRLSDDFIYEARKACKEKSIGIQYFKLLIPDAIRNREDEKQIIIRLNGYFRNSYQLQLTKIKEVKRSGIYFSLIGIALMLIAGYISFLKSDKYYIHILLVLFEPAGWFMLWAGLDHFIYSIKKINEDLKFYSTLSKVHIDFASYQD